MIEFYLFVDPTCRDCEHSEKIIMQLTKKLACKTAVKFIPMMELRAVPKVQGTSCPSLYQIVLDYKAASFQGCRKGREFLLEMQEKALNDHIPYSDDLVNQVAREVGLDEEMFKKDRSSRLTKLSLRSDRKLIKEMHIADHGNLVIFDCESTDNGLLIGDVDKNELKDVCDYIIKRKHQKLEETIARNNKFKIL